MSYREICEMAKDQDLADREIACMACRGVISPEFTWQRYRWQIVSCDDFVNAWGGARKDRPAEGLGAAEDVITDELITRAVKVVVEK